MRVQLWLGDCRDVFRHLAGLRALHHYICWSTHHSHSCWCLCRSTWVSPSEHQPLTRLPSIKYHWTGICTNRCVTGILKKMACVSDRSQANSILLPEWQTRLSGQAVSQQKAVVRSSGLPSPRKPPALHWQAVWCWASFPSASLRVCTWEMQILLAHLIRHCSEKLLWYECKPLILSVAHSKHSIKSQASRVKTPKEGTLCPPGEGLSVLRAVPTIAAGWSARCLRVVWGLSWWSGT